MEHKLYAVPADWPQPLFALGETVYDLDDKERGRAPVAGQIIGLLAHDACTWDDAAEAWRVVGKSWVYTVAWPGYSPSEWNEDSLTRDAWEHVPSAHFEGPVLYSGPDDFDPFLDADNLP